MKNWIFWLLATPLLFFACQQDGGGAQQPQQRASQAEEMVNLLGGDWIPLDFCARAGQYGSVLGAMNNAHRPYAYALSFDPEEPDSARCFDGEKSWTCAISVVADTIAAKADMIATPVTAVATSVVAMSAATRATITKTKIALRLLQQSEHNNHRSLRWFFFERKLTSNSNQPWMLY